MNLNFDVTIKSDNSLMLEVARGNDNALSELIKRYKNRLFNYLLKGLIADNDIAREIVHRTFIRVYEHRNNYKYDYEFSTWIYTICRRLALNELRDNRNIKLDDAFLANEPFSEEESYAIIIEKEENSVIAKEILGKMEPKYKEVITLRFINGFTYNQISSMTGQNINTLKSLCKRGLEIMRTKFERVEYGRQ